MKVHLWFRSDADLPLTQFVRVQREGTDVWKMCAGLAGVEKQCPVTLCLFISLDLVALLPALHATVSFYLTPAPPANLPNPQE